MTNRTFECSIYDARGVPKHIQFIVADGDVSGETEMSEGRQAQKAAYRVFQDIRDECNPELFEQGDIVAAIETIDDRVDSVKKYY